MKLITTSREGGKWQEREFVFAGGIKSGIPLVIVDETKTYQTVSYTHLTLPTTERV